MSFLTSYMEAALAQATDPAEIELRRKVLEDQKAAEQLDADRREAETAVLLAAREASDE